VSRVRYLGLVLLMLFLIPSALAYGRTRIIALDRGIEMISNVFNIQVLENNSWVQEGFLKFMIFIVLFAVSHFGLKKANILDNKTSGIVSFAFSMIGVFMMPTDWLMATGGVITAIMSSFVFLLIFVGGGVVAMFVLKPKDENDPMGWLKNLLGLMLLFFLLFLIQVWADATKMPLLLLFGQDWLRKKIGKR
jgi:hypothetical protein